MAVADTVGFPVLMWTSNIHTEPWQQTAETITLSDDAADIGCSRLAEGNQIMLDQLPSCEAISACQCHLPFCHKASVFVYRSGGPCWTNEQMSRKQGQLSRMGNARSCLAIWVLAIQGTQEWMLCLPPPQTGKGLCSWQGGFVKHYLSSSMCVSSKAPEYQLPN